MNEQQRSTGSVAPPQSAAASAASAEDDASFLAALRPGGASGRPAASFRYTRWVFLRALGLIYVVAFSILQNQGLQLLGANGLLPAAGYVERLKRFVTFWERPTVFWLGAGDGWLSFASSLGLALALLLLLGVDHVAVLVLLWAIYLSFVHVGQIFYGYGWETLLLEAGLLATFLGTLRNLSCLHDRRLVPRVMFWWLIWLLFRVMFGAGLIKLRGDSCWRDLTCLYYHYETQPVPHPLSRLLHHAPRWFHQAGVLFNHFVELLVPFGLFVPRLRNAAASITVLFQIVLILSGNLAFLNWLTIAVAFGCMDDRVWARVLPRRLLERWPATSGSEPASRYRLAFVSVYSVVVVLLSVEPTLNLLSSRQAMNSSFEPLHIVNTYGAFGSIGRVRDEVILEGTDDPDPSSARYRPYEFKCKPGDIERMPCWITPYHYRLDWQMWFAALSNFDRQPWLAHLIYKLLHNAPEALSLIANQPFPEAPPKYIRAQRYRYQFTELGEHGYWKRRLIGQYAPALSRDDPRLRRFLQEYGLLSR